MKLTNKIFVLAGVISALTFFSCGSTANVAPQKKTEKTETEPESNEITAASLGSVKSVGEAAGKLPPPPAKLTEAPKFDFTGSTLQIEAENTYYDGFDLVGDAQASQSYAIKLLNDSSWAIAEINFPAGTYEGTVRVLAPDSNHSKFNVYINKDTYLVYGSEPPIGKYELTTRSVVSFTLDQPTTVTLKIQQNDIKNPENNGQNGMTIDYVSFKKVK